MTTRDDGSPQLRPAWRDLGRKAKSWRLLHASWAVAQLTCLAELWASVIRRQRSPRLWAGVAFLGVEGGALLIGRGNCPVGPRQAEWGDPVPFFELLLPPPAAKAAIPFLAIVTVTGMALLAVRKPGLRIRA